MSPAFWRGSFFMPVLSEAWTTRNGWFRLFGTRPVPVLEFDELPSSTALNETRHNVGADAERLLVE